MPMIGRFKYIICLFWFMFHSLRGLWLDLQLPVQSVPITTEVVSWNPVHDEVYSIQHYVIKFVSDLREVCGFLLVLRFPSPIKLTVTIQLKYCSEGDVKYHKPKQTKHPSLWCFILKTTVSILNTFRLFIFVYILVVVRILFLNYYYY